MTEKRKTARQMLEENCDIEEVIIHFDWDHLVELEPRLQRLLEEAKGTPVEMKNNHTWYHEFKPRMRQLVGWGAEKRELTSSESYNIAYEKIYNALIEGQTEEQVLGPEPAGDRRLCVQVKLVHAPALKEAILLIPDTCTSLCTASKWDVLATAIPEIPNR